MIIGLYYNHYTIGMGVMHQTAQFTLNDIDNMLKGMDIGKSYNYQGTEAVPGELALTRSQLEQFKSELEGKGNFAFLLNIQMYV